MARSRRSDASQVGQDHRPALRHEYWLFYVLPTRNARAAGMGCCSVPVRRAGVCLAADLHVTPAQRSRRQNLDEALPHLFRDVAGLFDQYRDLLLR